MIRLVVFMLEFCYCSKALNHHNRHNAVGLNIYQVSEGR